MSPYGSLNENFPQDDLIGRVCIAVRLRIIRSIDKGLFPDWG